jgi:DNA-binding IclR family transcriptional regulator
MTPDDLMQECMRTLHSRAAQEYHTSWPDLAEVLEINGATARKLIADLRRRGFVAAPGLYPTALGMREWMTLPENSSRWKIMRLVVENWLNPSEPAITLTTLERTLDASRSTINLSIVRLRDMNYLEPRGTIVPTGVWND